jgi:hypothetical protein
MTIFKKKEDPTNANEPPVQVADFSYAPNDSLAEMIVDAWVDKDFRDLLLNPANAKAVFATRGFYWNGTIKKPVVISEEAYHAGYTQQDDDEVVFVLPKHDGRCPPGQNLLDTAKLLMGLTPNGI